MMLFMLSVGNGFAICIDRGPVVYGGGRSGPIGRDCAPAVAGGLVEGGLRPTAVVAIGKNRSGPRRLL
jgi:hypothetical protein